MYRRRDTQTAATSGIDPYRTNAHDGGKRTGGVKKTKRKYFIAVGITVAMLVLSFVCQSVYVRQWAIQADTDMAETHMVFKKKEQILKAELERKLEALAEENISPESKAERMHVIKQENLKDMKEINEDYRKKDHEVYKKLSAKRDRLFFILLGINILGIMLVWLVAIFRKSGPKNSPLS